MKNCGPPNYGRQRYQLVEALGGEWDISTLPTQQKLIKGN